MTPHQITLAECPFCGGAAELRERGNWFGVGCDIDIKCNGHMHALMFGTAAEAVEAWNRRTPAAREAGDAIERERAMAEEPDEDDRWTIDRAADLLEQYAGYIREVKPDDIERHPYLPEVDFVASQLRRWFPATPSPSLRIAGADLEILAAVRREMDEVDSGNAPGHAHQIPGIWDGDNGAKAGKPCAWCLTWAKFTRLINEASAGHPRTPGGKQR